MLILRKPMEKYGNTFVCHNSIASLNGRIFKNRVYNKSPTFGLFESLQNICYLRAFDFRFTHSMIDTSMKKLENSGIIFEINEKYEYRSTSNGATRA